jgi:hypothetical protein
MVSRAGFLFDVTWVRRVRPDVALRAAPGEDDQMHHVEVTAGDAALSPVVDDVASFGASRDSYALDIGAVR